MAVNNFSSISCASCCNLASDAMSESLSCKLHYDDMYGIFTSIPKEKC